MNAIKYVCVRFVMRVHGQAVVERESIAKRVNTLLRYQKHLPDAQVRLDMLPSNRVELARSQRVELAYKMQASLLLQPSAS
jgi:ribosome-associated translation inhibitor RaiA